MCLLYREHQYLGESVMGGSTVYIMKTGYPTKSMHLIIHLCGFAALTV